MAAISFIGSPTYSTTVGSTSYTFSGLSGSINYNYDVLVFFSMAASNPASFFTVTDNVSNSYLVFALGAGLGGLYYYVAISPYLQAVPTSIVVSWSTSGPNLYQAEIEVWNSNGYVSVNADALSSNNGSGSTSLITVASFGDVVFSWFISSGGFTAYPTGWVHGISNVSSVYSAGLIDNATGTLSIPWSGTSNNTIVSIALLGTVSFGGTSNRIYRPSFNQGPRW